LSVGADRMGTVRLGREKWHAEATDGGGLAAGTEIEVVEIRGTRAIVRPVAAD
jgi:membrane protein implicated in regulation of membrane protease activity